MAKKKSRTFKVREKGNRLIGDWVRRSNVCVFAGWPGLEEFGCTECEPSLISNNGIEAMHVIRRSQSKVNMISPFGILPGCGGHHTIFDNLEAFREKFMKDVFPGRLEHLRAIDLEHHLNGYPKLLPIYEEQLEWIEGRPEDESWADWDEQWIEWQKKLRGAA